MQRFLLPNLYRHSEDLDFFFPALQDRKSIQQVADEMADTINSLPNAKIEQFNRIKEEQSYRIWCSFSDNNEAVKVELLNFTCSREKDKSFVTQLFKTENFYNLLLYKFKALCDRPDTIKDLFDIYFILRELPQINTKELIENMNKKFQKAIGYKYSIENITTSLKQNLKWDIEIADIQNPFDLQKEIETFKLHLLKALETKEFLDFSYKTRIEQNAKKLNLDTATYLELIEVLEENSFWANEVMSIQKKVSKIEED